ncbi:MAG: response regulator [Nitrospirota bacterium]
MVEYGILIVDDEPYVSAALRRVLADEPCRICSAERAMEGMAILKNHYIKVVISDERMPEMTGSEFLSAVRRDFPNVIRIILTGHASIDSAMRAINDGEIYRFLTKPWDDNEMRLTIRAAIEKYDLEEENRRLLKMVKDHALNLRLLEKIYPGITDLERDSDGKIVLPDMSDEEMSQIVAQLEEEFGQS